MTLVGFPHAHFIFETISGEANIHMHMAINFCDAFLSLTAACKMYNSKYLIHMFMITQ